jgi:drug/metabolite transporter (DMT)-like permease
MLKKTDVSGITAVAMLIAAAVIWGSAFVVVKDSLNYITPMWQLVCRLAVASVGGIIIYITQEKYVCRKYVIQGIVLGVIFAAALIFQNYGADFSTASKCAFLTVSYVAFTPLIGVVFLRKKLTFKKITAVIICMTGVGLITLNGKLHIEKGDLFLLAAGLAYAIHILWIDHCSEKNGVLVIHIIQIWTALLISLPVAFFTETFRIPHDKSFMEGIIYCGIFEVLIGFLLQFKGQQKTSPSLAGIILSSECVFAGIFGAVFQGDCFDLKMTAGCFLIFASAIIESLSNNL